MNPAYTNVYIIYKLGGVIHANNYFSCGVSLSLRGACTDQCLQLYSSNISVAGRCLTREGPSSCTSIQIFSHELIKNRLSLFVP